MSAFLALGAAVCFGCQAIAIERGMKIAISRSGKRRESAFFATLVTIIVSASLFWILSLIFERPWSSFSISNITPFLIVGLAYPGFFRLLYFEGIDRVGSSVSAAIIAANPVISVLGALLFLGEFLNVPAGVGLVLIVGGGASLQIASQTVREDRSAGKDLVLNQLESVTGPDLMFPVGAMILLGGSYVLIKHGLAGFPHPITASALAQSVGLLVLCVVFYFTDGSGKFPPVRPGNETLYFLGAGILVALAWLGQFFALNLGKVTLVIPLVYTYPLVVLVLAYALEREWPRSYIVILGTISIISGAVLLRVF